MPIPEGDPLPTSGPLASPATWDLVSTDYALEIAPQLEPYAADALALVAPPSGARIVDVACGPGTLSFLAARHAAHVAAIDFSPAMIDRLSTRLSNETAIVIEARVGDGQALPYPDLAFDAGFSLFGLMFFPDRARGFTELHRVVRPGGRVAVSSWNAAARVPALVSLIEAVEEHLPGLGGPRAPSPLGEADDYRREMVGFAGVEVHASVHALDYPSGEAMFASFTRTFAPLVLLRKRLGDEAFAPLADKLRASLLARMGDGPQRVEMPAWIGVGTRSG